MRHVVIKSLLVVVLGESNKVLKIEYRLSSSWTKRNKKYIPNFSEELFLKQNKNSRVDPILKQTVAMQVTKTHFNISLTEINEELWSHSYCQIG
jgi:transcription initiation factor TFIIIB Brf1 subunit/transcription initiation factor TFIIB